VIEAMELLVIVIGAYLLGYVRAEVKEHKAGFDLGYQKGRREGWEAATEKLGPRAKVLEFGKN